MFDSIKRMFYYFFAVLINGSKTGENKMNKQLKITRAYIDSDFKSTIVIPLPEGDITEFLLAHYGIDALPLIITEVITCGK